MGSTTPGKVLIICDSKQTQEQVAKTLKRLSTAFAAFITFNEYASNLDENSNNLAEEMAKPLTRLLLTVIQIYPEGPEQMSADVRAIGDFAVHT